MADNPDSVKLREIADELTDYSQRGEFSSFLDGLADELRAIADRLDARVSFDRDDFRRILARALDEYDQRTVDLAHSLMDAAEGDWSVTRGR